MQDNETLLETADLVQIFRLVHELCEMGNDAHAWRSRMLMELRRMTDADMMSAYVMKLTVDPANIGPTLLLKMIQHADDSWEEYVDRGDLTTNPANPWVVAHLGTDFAVTRQEIVSDRDWYGSAFYADVAAKANWDHVIYAQVAITPPGVIDGLHVTRAVGRPPFSAREVGIVRFLHGELARMWRRPDPVGIHSLPPRQREVLDGIRRGESRKLIADKMSVSDHTVHTYEKALFERAGVKSRGELLARVAQLIRPNLLP